jgi:8-hydroxy-5-deazaflavin:NADPH oxidoreductase
MKIAVIGCGAMGSTLAGRWASLGHEVAIANSRGVETVRPIAQPIGAVAADLSRVAVAAEVIVLAMPFPATATLPPSLFASAAADVAIVDVANYYPDIRDPRIAEIDAGMPESVWVAQRLGRPIFKAFNSLMHHSLASLARPEGTPDRLAAPVAGDDPTGKARVMGLVDAAGFDPVDAGPLSESWRQQPSTPAYCCDYGVELTVRGLQAAVKGRAEIIRDTAWREGYLPLFADAPDPSEVHPKVIALNRSLNPLMMEAPND